MKDGYCDILFVEKRKEPSDPKRNYRVEKISTSTPGIINAFYKKLSEAVDSQYKIHRDKIFEEREKRSLGIETK